MPECGAPDPEHPEVTCTKPPDAHPQHSAGSNRSWPNIPVVEERERWAATRPGAKKADRTKAVLDLAGKASGRKSGGGPAAAAEGAQKAYVASTDEFKDRAFDALHAVATRQESLTADDVWEYLRQSGFDVDGEEHRTAMGHVMKAGPAKGWTEKTSGMVKTERGEQRAHGLTVWHSLLRTS